MTNAEMNLMVVFYFMFEKKIYFNILLNENT